MIPGARPQLSGQAALPHFGDLCAHQARYSNQEFPTQNPREYLGYLAHDAQWIEFARNIVY